MSGMTPNPASLLVIFGATGDLAQRMLLPSIYGLFRDGLLPGGFRILGTARSELDSAQFRTMVAEAILRRVNEDDRDEASLKNLLAQIDYQAAALDDTDSIHALTARIAALRTGRAVLHRWLVRPRADEMGVGCRNHHGQDGVERCAACGG